MFCLNPNFKNGVIEFEFNFILLDVSKTFNGLLPLRGLELGNLK